MGPPARSNDPATLPEAGYRRGDMLVNIYNGRFGLAPAGGLDNVRYYAQAFGELAEQCPNLGLAEARYQVLPYIVANMRDTVERVQAGRGTQAELLQMGWYLLLQLRENSACTYDPSVTSKAEAQVRCNSAGRATSEVGVLPSVDAAHDVTLFVGRNACTSSAAARLARQMIAFGRQAHARLQFTARMPGPDTPAGRSYMQIFENCSRQAPDNAADGWCSCYVQTLSSVNPPSDVLKALSNNPFVDGATYMTWVSANVPGGDRLYACSDRDHGRLSNSRAYGAPRTTACLVDAAPKPSGDYLCTFRAAWGDFTTTEMSCRPEINSRRWGYREVDCGASGTELSRKGPRDWRLGIYRMVDYEQPVPDDFVAPLPADARKTAPIRIRLLKRAKRGLLVSMELSGVSVLPIPADFATGSPLERATFALDQEGALLLECRYVGSSSGLVEVRTYWYEKVPEYVSRGGLDTATGARPFGFVRGVATTCPVTLPR